MQLNHSIARSCSFRLLVRYNLDVLGDACEALQRQLFRIIDD